MITLKRDKPNEKQSGGVILLSYKTYLKNDDIVFANIVNERIKNTDNVFMNGVTPDGDRIHIGFVGGRPQDVLANVEKWKASIVRIFKEKGANIKLVG